MFTFKKLFNIDQNAKTVKGQKRGFMTAVMYLAPYLTAGINVCPMAALAGCWKGCLTTAGRGGIALANAVMNPFGIEVPDNAVQRCRIARTLCWAEDRDTFWITLRKEIEAFIKKAERKGMTPAVRLNGTSDIQWERFTPYYPGGVAHTIFEMFPDVQFYDYTKIGKRFYSELPANYHLTLSYSEASPKYMQMCLDTVRDTGCSIALVVRDKAAKARMIAAGYWMGLECVDGDVSDLRFLDGDAKAVLLTAKGRARKDDSGFVIDVDDDIGEEPKSFGAALASGRPVILRRK